MYNDIFLYLSLLEDNLFVALFGIPDGDYHYQMIIWETTGSEISLWFPLYHALPGHVVTAELVLGICALGFNPL